MAKVLNEFGKLIRKERSKKGWTQEELAYRAKLHLNFVSRLERGLENPSLLSIERLARALGHALQVLRHCVRCNSFCEGEVCELELRAHRGRVRQHFHNARSGMAVAEGIVHDPPALAGLLGAHAAGVVYVVRAVGEAEIGLPPRHQAVEGLAETLRIEIRTGGAAGTIAKTISAYDMTVSDAIYGAAERYVTRQRLQSMLDHEYGLLTERLQSLRGATTRFFVFADTVKARGFKTSEESHGWLGLRFQTEPLTEPSQIIKDVPATVARMAVRTVLSARSASTPKSRPVASSVNGASGPNGSASTGGASFILTSIGRTQK